METIDIILLTCNRLNFLKKVIESYELGITIPFRLIVINNNSNDGTKEYLDNLESSAKYPVIVLHRGDGEELPGSYANNEAFKYVDSEYFIASQDDIVIPKLSPCVLQQLIKHMKDNLDIGALCLRDTSMRREPKDGEQFLFGVRACPAWFRIQRKSDIETAGGFGGSTRWEDSDMVKICNSINKKSGFVSDLLCDNLGLDEDRGYPDWYIKSRLDDKRFEWIGNKKKQFSKKNN